MNWKQILIILSLIVLIVLIIKQYNIAKYSEGFTQKAPYLLKTNNDIYDEFYAKIYGHLFKRKSHCQFELDKIINMTHPSDKSIFLEIGSGTGELLNCLNNVGFNAHGLESSQSMIKYSENKYPNIIVHNNDATNPMAFDKGTFTHICCLDFTFYHMKDKEKFLKNCYFWLMPNGYLIIHLVNRDKYDTTVPSANPLIEDSPQNYTSSRIMKTNIDFSDFTYTNSVKINDEDVTIREKFTDASTHNVRENELTLKMENLEKIEKMCLNAGFLAKGKVKYIHDKEQYIYIFEKQM